MRDEKVIFLAKELHALRSANQKLKYAMALGDSSLLDSLEINTAYTEEILSNTA